MQNRGQLGVVLGHLYDMHLIAGADLSLCIRKYIKLKANIEEVRARGGELYVFADAETQISPSDQVHVIQMSKHYAELSPILHVVPLQLLAYHTALARGTDVDKPRNLAKSVTVE